MILGAMKETSPEITSKLESVALTLYKLYSSAEPYEVYPDAKNFLENFTTMQRINCFDPNRLRLGIISNFDKRLVGVVEELKLSQYFDFITYSEESGYSKPKKEIFEEAVRRSGLQNLKGEEILHIGDDLKKDYFGAKSLGWNALIIQRDINAKTELLCNKSIQSNFGNSTIMDDICDSFNDVESKIFESPQMDNK